MDRQAEILLLVLQGIQVAILWLHDWVPFFGFTDPVAARQENPGARLAIVTCVQSVPYSFGLVASLMWFGQPTPMWLANWLAVSYAILLTGEIRAWWWPYLVSPDPARAARYQVMFGRTRAFLPMRHGMVPNTLHVVLHVATLATVILTI